MTNYKASYCSASSFSGSYQYEYEFQYVPTSFRGSNNGSYKSIEKVVDNTKTVQVYGYGINLI